MKNTTLTRKLAALVLALVGGQVALAAGAGAYELTWTNRNGPPAQTPAPAAGAPAPAAAAQAPTAAPTMQQVEQRLAALRYDVGPADGTVDAQTNSAVMAFQKVSGLPRTGEMTDAVAGQIMGTQTSPAPLVANGEPNRIEVSLARQVLFLYNDGVLNRILPVSSGTSETPTPTGEYRIYRQDAGWHTSRLGRLHNAQYFVGGYAIHGSNSVPAQPASHGCIRIPMTASEWFPSQVAMGMQVLIIEG
jgi:peptidoglycan hydrolase-like protein with peptidoglycan-binding domain